YEWSIDPAQWSAVTFHADEKCVNRFARRADVLVKPRLDVIRVCHAENAPALQVDPVSDLCSHVKVRMFAQERDPGNRTAFYGYAFELIELHHVLKSDRLQD